MSDQQPLMRSLRSFAASMGKDYDLAEMSHRLCEELTNALIVGGAGVAVSGEDGRLAFLTASSQPIVEIEKVQVADQNGPCVAAFQSQRPVVVEDVTKSDWPEYSAVAQANGMHSVVGYPLSRDGARLGALNVYARTTREWTSTDLDIVAVFADMATAYLVRVERIAELSQLTTQLQTALDSRVLTSRPRVPLSGADQPAQPPSIQSK